MAHRLASPAAEMVSAAAAPAPPPSRAARRVAGAPCCLPVAVSVERVDVLPGGRPSDRIRAHRNGSEIDSGIAWMADQLALDIIEKIKAHADAGTDVGLESDLMKLGIHSLELTEIVFDLEESYGIDIDMNTVEAWGNLKTVGDIVESTRALIAARAA
jgi:nodulation protein F